jgi:hypothetical protein
VGKQLDPGQEKPQARARDPGEYISADEIKEREGGEEEHQRPKLSPEVLSGRPQRHGHHEEADHDQCFTHKVLNSQFQISNFNEE